MPWAPQNRITIAAAAPPHRASVCGRYGTARGACARAGATEPAAAQSAAAITNTFTPSVYGDDDQDDEQNDDDGRRRDDNGRAAGKILIDGARLAGSRAELVSLQSRHGGVRAIDREAGFIRHGLDGRVLQERAQRFAVRLL